VAAPPPQPTDGAPEGSRTPTTVRVAVVVLWILAGLLLANTALTLVALNGLVERATRVSTVSRAQAEQGILVSLIPLVLLGVILGLSAWGLGRRRAWARWTGLGAGLMLFALTLLTMLAAGSLLLISLLLLLSMTACISLLSRSTAEWVPRLRA
jgi:ABC-type Na+ efflux pump permease subunit